jgi:hypothetical protein
LAHSCGAHSLWCLRRHVHGPDVRARTTRPSVHPRVRLRVCIVERLRLPRRHMALRSSRGDLGDDRAEALPIEVTNARAPNGHLTEPSASGPAARKPPRPAAQHTGLRRRSLSPAGTLVADRPAVGLLSMPDASSTMLAPRRREPAAAASLATRFPPLSQRDRYPGIPSRSLLRARCRSCRSCTPGSQSNVADGPSRGSPRTSASRKACTYARSWSIRACT